MRYDRSEDAVVVSSDELSSFALKKSGNNSTAAQFRPSDPRDLSGAKALAAPSVSVVFRDTGIRLVCSGSFAAFEEDGVLFSVSSKKVRKLPETVSPSYDYAFFAVSMLNAFILSASNGGAAVIVVMKYESGDSSVSCEGVPEPTVLKASADALLERAFPTIAVVRERGTAVRNELNALRFPYRETRGGQRDLMVETMRTIRVGGKLLACAPTGIGKTVSVLYPALKSIGAELADKIFYLTAKGVTGNAAADLVKRISADSAHVRCVSLESKDRACPTGGAADGCFGCPLSSEITAEGVCRPAALRIEEAAAEVCRDHGLIDRSAVISAAEKHRVCPHELFLKVTEFCEIVICDYNYVFDERIKLKRYFGENGSFADERYVFLIDEAHNLPDRVRGTYSATVTPEDFAELFDLIRSGAVADEKLEGALADVFTAFGEILDECGENASLRGPEDGEKLYGFVTRKDIPEKLYDSLAAFRKACVPHIKKGCDFRDGVRRICSVVSDVIFAADHSDGKFRFLAEREDGRIRCSVFCLDPSALIAEAVRKARATVMFSATLSPKEYFLGVTGFRDEEYIELDSPFDPGNLSVTVCDSVSTRLADRKATAEEVAEFIYSAVDSKAGKYLIFFPSHEYLKTVLREFLKIAPDIPTAAQKPEMTARERGRFISLFSSDKYKSLVGFCVLGGMFSEGIDLSGEALIGVVVVGAGLAGLSSSLNLVSEYYDEKFERGYEFSYLFPAVNRIQQAVGRVIRTETDVGIAVLIDSRLSDPSSLRLFPSSWHPLKAVSDPESLRSSLGDFWKKHDQAPV